MIEIRTNVAHAQAKGVVLSMQIGSVVLFLGRKSGDCLVHIAIMTPYRWLSVCVGRRVLVYI